MNPKEEEEQQEEDVSRMQTDVTDEEMALRYKHASLYDLCFYVLSFYMTEAGRTVKLTFKPAVKHLNQQLN